MADSLATTPHNQKQAAALRRSLEELLRRGTERGFYGSIHLECNILDGSLSDQHQPLLKRRLKVVEG